MEYLNLRATIPIQLYVFSNPAVYAAFREREKPELILVGDCYADWKDAEDCPVLVLTINREYIGRTQYFFRYQSVEHLVETMLQMIGANQPCVTETGMFYAVYSPLGRCGKTTFAKKLCERIGNSLYVNWEGISECLDEKGIGSWMLYCMKSRNEPTIDIDGNRLRHVSTLNTQRGTNPNFTFCSRNNPFFNVFIPNTYFYNGRRQQIIYRFIVIAARK